ncbi:MAG: HTH domain-containing protein [Saprospiraceae bacterium]|nr:HTH domain-containing protein [Candidatus Vicinibacter affinis]
MSAKPKQMHQIRTIFQLKNAGFSIRKIANQTGMSRNTIREYLRLIESIGIDHKAALELSDEDFIELIL